VATSKAKKRKKKAQAQHRQQHAQSKDRDRSAHHEHLPKAGTAEDDAYLLRRSREDIVDFGLTERKRGPINGVIIVAVLLFVGLAVLGLIAITR
jgi:hypothetical protein